MHPRLRGKPVAVIAADTESTSAIAASYEAKAFGIKTGTPIYEARKMCPGLICVLGQHRHYSAYHDRLVTEIGRHIPVARVCSIDEVACRLLRNESDPKQATAIAQSIKKGIAENVGEYLRCSIGIAQNRFLAKIATDMQKPDGLTILQSHDSLSRISELALRDIPGIGRRIEKKLNAAGIFNMRDLLALQPKHLRAVWGSVWGEKMWYWLRGYDLPDDETKRGSVGHSHVLEPSLRPPDQALIIARRLTMKATARLRRMEYHARVLTLGVRTECGCSLAMETTCMPAQDVFTFLEMMESLWTIIMRETSGRRLKKVGVTLHGLVPDGSVGAQGDLFTPSSKPRARENRISAVIDNLNRKFGKDTVLLGMTPQQGRSFTGTKIAFTRIPDPEEYLE